MSDTIAGDSSEASAFVKHRDQTAADVERVAQILTDLAADIRQGNMAAFEQFWLEGGTEEGDAKIFAIREMLMLRYGVRQEELEQ